MKEKPRWDGNLGERVRELEGVRGRERERSSREREFKRGREKFKRERETEDGLYNDV